MELVMKSLISLTSRELGFPFTCTRAHTPFPLACSLGRGVQGMMIAYLAVVSVSGIANAQIPEVSPGGQLAEPAAPPPQAAPTPVAPIIIGPDGRQIGEGGGNDDSGFYFTEGDGPRGGLGSFGSANQPLFSGGTIPSSHIVRRGDTLWDITWFYFNNPFNWPKVWSYNPKISNPHWIYPGDQVRLYPEGQGPKPDAAAVVGIGQPDVNNNNDNNQPNRRPSSDAGEFSLRQVAFVSDDKLNFSAVIDGSTDEKLMLSLGDSVYLSYSKNKPPKIGKRYAIYKSRETVKHPVSGDRVGAFVRVIGELEVVSVKKGKRARAIITNSTDVIERGALVGPLKRQFKKIKVSPNEVDAQGTIVAQLFADQLIGATQVVSIDLGSKAGLKEGNRLFVVRRGDAYEDLGGKLSNAGQDDRRFPARAIGEIIVVQVGKTSSLCLVNLVIQEIAVGDKVLIRKSKK